jgi:hypothetical protein
MTAVGGDGRFGVSGCGTKCARGRKGRRWGRRRWGGETGERETTKRRSDGARERGSEGRRGDDEAARRRGAEPQAQAQAKNARVVEGPRCRVKSDGV